MPSSFDLFIRKGCFEMDLETPLSIICLTPSNQLALFVSNALIRVSISFYVECIDD